MPGKFFRSASPVCNYGMFGWGCNIKGMSTSGHTLVSEQHGTYIIFIFLSNLSGIYGFQCLVSLIKQFRLSHKKHYPWNSLRSEDNDAHMQIVGTLRFKSPSCQLSALNTTTCGLLSLFNFKTIPKIWSSVPVPSHTIFSSTPFATRVTHAAWVPLNKVPLNKVEEIKAQKFAFHISTVKLFLPLLSTGVLIRELLCYPHAYVHASCETNRYPDTFSSISIKWLTYSEHYGLRFALQ